MITKSLVVAGLVSSLSISGLLAVAPAPVAPATAKSAPGALRSALYPEDWKPATPDAKGRFLHDFSYAGYRKSEVPIPVITKNVVDVTRPPYNVDPTGKTEATPGIQKALDDVGTQGGGVVFLPEGTYLVRSTGKADQPSCLTIRHRNVVLRGAGMGKTRLYCDETNFRRKSVVMLMPSRIVRWIDDVPSTPVTADLELPTTQIPVESTEGLSVGDLVNLRTDPTEQWIAEVGMTGKWKNDLKGASGFTLLRRVVAVDPAGRVVTLDTPTRYPMLRRDKLRLGRMTDYTLRESGVEDLSIGQKEHPAPPEAFKDNDTNVEGTAGYTVHWSTAVTFQHCEDAWLLRVGSYLPEGNKKHHILSNGVRLYNSRQVTVQACDFRFPQYLGAGNGYLYTFAGNECLVRDSHAEGGRHNYDFQQMSCIGNVVYNSVSKAPRLASDFHMWFSTANLLDGMTSDGDYFECTYRPYGGVPEHGVTGSQNVFWNTRGISYGKDWPYIVLSAQFGHGYVIGTRGPAPAVSPKSTGFIEHVGRGDELQPQSLWQDQLARRLRAAGATPASK